MRQELAVLVALAAAPRAPGSRKDLHDVGAGDGGAAAPEVSTVLFMDDRFTAKLTNLVPTLGEPEEGLEPAHG